MDLIAFGGEIWLRIGWPVWLTGAGLALFAGLCCGWALVDAIRRTVR